VADRKKKAPNLSARRVPKGERMQVPVRLRPDLLTELDVMIAAQPKARPTRAHAIREITKATFSLLAKDRG
jgi:hypothetical protein